MIYVCNSLDDSIHSVWKVSDKMQSEITVETAARFTVKFTCSFVLEMTKKHFLSDENYS